MKLDWIHGLLIAAIIITALGQFVNGEKRHERSLKEWKKEKQKMVKGQEELNVMICDLKEQLREAQQTSTDAVSKGKEQKQKSEEVNAQETIKIANYSPTELELVEYHDSTNREFYGFDRYGN